jgi:DNA invertase Pin-like site-specific DNA recombinase
LGQRAALYCRVSTADQSCARQERDLTTFAARAGYEICGVFKETGSGAKLDRAERKKVMALAQRREIDAVLVTELSRWGRSTIRSGIAAAKACGKRLGRQPGQRPKSDRFAPKVLALVATGRSYRRIGRELGLSKNTVLEIVKRSRAISA